MMNFNSDFVGKFRLKFEKAINKCTKSALEADIDRSNLSGFNLMLKFKKCFNLRDLVRYKRAKLRKMGTP